MGCHHSKGSGGPSPRPSPSMQVASSRPTSPRAASHGSIGSVVSQLITPAHKELLNETWAQLAPRHVEVGMRVFQLIFARAPEVKSMFPFGDAEGDELIANEQFRAHAGYFMGVIGAALADVDDLEGRMGRRLLELGAEHAMKPGFNLDYFEVFTGGLGEAWGLELGEDWDSEARAAWEKLFLYLMMELRAGYMIASEGDRLEEEERLRDEREEEEGKELNGRELAPLVPPRVVVSPPVPLYTTG